MPPGLRRRPEAVEGAGVPEAEAGRPLRKRPVDPGLVPAAVAAVVEGALGCPFHLLVLPYFCLISSSEVPILFLIWKQ